MMDSRELGEMMDSQELEDHLRISREVIDKLRQEVAQCSVELEEAANLLEHGGFPHVADAIYREAAKRARNTLELTR